ncbi:GNAT family N-acetyltransferase [Hazenella coriacea]|uniref:Ribosomal-protein-alanine N-acetyltransferase n=1 Tax=Hazenella coriacea TaxID=1179467 RepID=A0A4R3L9Q5_9BACL|nr:GNAT family protein [Hazenella coriacea]TCS95845.1 ribosomal-protein-alanine N-acetyltransferase [Hazenella coriacea]
MTNIMIEPIQTEVAEELLAFELENRAFFEKVIMPRPDEYYQLDHLKSLIHSYEEEQKQDLCYMYIIRNEQREIIGRINLFSIIRAPLHKAEIGYRIGEKHNGKGYATAAVSQVIHEAFHTLHFHRLEADTDPHNIGSQIVLIKNGFQFVGRTPQHYYKDGQWIDSVHLSLVNPHEISLP